MRQDDWDDGRTVADMTGVTRRPMLRPGRPVSRDPEEPEKPAGPLDGYSPKERRWAILGAMRAALLIGLAYAAGLGLLILLLVCLWNR